MEISSQRSFVYVSCALIFSIVDTSHMQSIIIATPEKSDITQVYMYDTCIKKYVLIHISQFDNLMVCMVI